MKLRFAHQLRAIAALSVVLYHYWGIFFSPAVRSLTGVPASFMPLQPAYTKHVLSSPPGGLIYGVFGVAVFFLISGFVIPISLRNISTREFLIRRFFRIYPVYWFCLLISIGMYFICSMYWSTPLSDRISSRFLLANLPLLHSAKGLPSLDFVCWSLVVELKFYVVVALIFACGRNAHRRVLLTIGFLMACGMAAWFTTHGAGAESFLAYAVSDMKYMTFMFLGCLFYDALYGELGARAALGYGAIIYGLFVMISSFYEKEWLGPLAKNYTFALILFSACYLLRDRFRSNRIIDFVADISFPLYLIHSMIGYVAMPMLINEGCSFTLAWMISLTVTVLVAYLVHECVEVPVNDLGKRLSDRRLGRPLQGLSRG